LSADFNEDGSLGETDNLGNLKIQVACYWLIACKIGESWAIKDRQDGMVSHYTVIGVQKSELIESNKMLVQAGVKT
jgi:hypothetical protein